MRKEKFIRFINRNDALLEYGVGPGFSNPPPLTKCFLPTIELSQKHSLKTYGESLDFKKDIEEQYSGDAGRQYHDAVNAVPAKAYDWVAKLRSEKISSFINENDVVLEYGVGTGWNISEINCKKRLGYDLSQHLKPLLKKKKISFIEDINHVQGGSIDAVICHHVLEHTSNPFEVLNHINRILSKDGKLVLFVPFELARRYRRYNPDDINCHLYSWNVQTLGALVEKSGFKVTKGLTRRFGYDRFASTWAVKLKIGEIGFRLIRSLIQSIKPVSEVCIIARKKNDLL